MLLVVTVIHFGQISDDDGCDDLVKILCVLTELRGEKLGARESAEPPAGEVEGEYSHPTYIPTPDRSEYQELEMTQR